jgi:hypothetical protein
MRTAVLGLLGFHNRSKPSEERERERASLLYYLSQSQTEGLWLWSAGFVQESSNPAKKGRENELVYSSPRCLAPQKPYSEAVVFELGL